MMKLFFMSAVTVGLVILIRGLVRAQEVSAGGSLKAPVQETAGQKARTERISGAKEEAPSGQSNEQASEVPPVESGAILEIKQLDPAQPLYSFELREAPLADLFRILAHDYKLNLLVDQEVEGIVTASLSNISLEDALEAIAGSQNLILSRDRNVIRVGPNLITKIFSIRYIEAKDVLESSSSERGKAENSSEEADGESRPGGASGSSASGESSDDSSSGAASTIYDLISSKGKILLGRQPNSIMVIDYPPNIERIGAYLKEIDRKMESRLFKLKYLRAAEVAGEDSSGSSSTESSLDSSMSSGGTSGISSEAAAAHAAVGGA